MGRGWAPPWRAHRALQRHCRAGQHGGGGAAGGRRPPRAAQAGGHRGLRLHAAELRRRGCSARAAAGSVPRCEARTSAGALVRPDARPTPFAWSDLNMEWQSERVGQSAMGRQRGVLSQMLIRLGRSPRGQHRLPLREQRMQTVCTRPTKRSSVPGPSDVQPEARNQPCWQDTAGSAHVRLLAGLEAARPRPAPPRAPRRPPPASPPPPQRPPPRPPLQPPLPPVRVSRASLHASSPNACLRDDVGPVRTLVSSSAEAGASAQLRAHAWA